MLVEHRSAFLEVIHSLNLTTEELIQGEKILTAEEQATLFGLVCQLRTTDKFIGFNSAKLHDIYDSGLPGILARSCGTIRDITEIHNKYYAKMDSEGVLSHLLFTNNTISYAFEKLAYAPFAIQEYALASTWVALTSLSPDVKHHCTGFEFPSTFDAHGFSKHELKTLCDEFSTQFSFSCGRLSLNFGLEVLNVTIPSVDPSLKMLLERKLRVLTGQTIAEDTEELRAQVFTAILELRNGSEPITLEKIAHFMGVKSEALAYALRSHGIQFQKLKALVE